MNDYDDVREERSGFPVWLLVAGLVFGLGILAVVGLGVGGFWYVQAQRREAMMQAEEAMYETDRARAESEATLARARAAAAEAQARLEEPRPGELADLWRWPPALRERFAGRAFGDRLDPDLRAAYAREENYPAQVRAVAGLAAPARIADEKAVIHPVTDWGQAVPSSEDVWLAAEDLTVRAELLRAVAAVNRDRTGPDLPVSVVESIAVGSPASDVRLKPARFSDPDEALTPAGQARLRYIAVTDRLRRLPVRLVLVANAAAADDVSVELARSRLRFRQARLGTLGVEGAPGRVRLTVEGVVTLVERPPVP
jgi:hypothetical protein